MKLDLQLTKQTKILLGILAVALFAAIVTQWGPGLYGLISNPAMKAKRETLINSKNLVAASQILKPVETGLYQKTGLSEGEEPTTIFEGNFPETVVREKIHAIVKKAGIPQNIQVNVEQVPGKRSERISPQARRNLVMFSYLKLLETEKDVLNAEMEAEIQAQLDAVMESEDDVLDMLMNAWLDEADGDSEKPPEEGIIEQEDIESDESIEQEDIESDESIEQEDIESDESKDKENPEEKEQADSDNKIENPEEKEQADSDNKIENPEEKEQADSDNKTENPEEKEHSKSENKIENPEENKSVDSNEISEVDKGPEDQSSEQSEDQQDSEILEDHTEWNFSSLPESLPIHIRIELIELIMEMVEQHLVGAQTTLFENQFFTTQTGGTAGIFGLGAKKPKIEISFNPNSQILAKFTNLVDTYGEELNKKELRNDLLEYLEKIQSQIAELSQKLKLAPTTYSPESYTVKVKFKAELEKLVNLNRLIETTTKWLMVRDLQISADNKDNKINVEVLMIARVYQ